MSARLLRTSRPRQRSAGPCRRIPLGDCGAKDRLSFCFSPRTGSGRSCPECSRGRKNWCVVRDSAGSSTTRRRTRVTRTNLQSRGKRESIGASDHQGRRQRYAVISPDSCTCIRRRLAPARPRRPVRDQSPYRTANATFVDHNPSFRTKQMRRSLSCRECKLQQDESSVGTPVR